MRILKCPLGAKGLKIGILIILINLILFDFNQNIGNIISNAFLIKYFTQSMHIGTCVMGTLRRGHSFNWAFVAPGSCNPYASIGANMTPQWRIIFEPTDCPMFFKMNKYGSQLKAKKTEYKSVDSVSKHRQITSCFRIEGPLQDPGGTHPNPC